jgi:hypothetical protein
LKVATTADAAAVADEVAGLMVEHAVTFAAPYASVDALLDEIGDRPGYVDYRVPALLAAAGRFAEAREVLAEFDPNHGPLGQGSEDRGRAGRRFVHQPERWIDSGGDRALIPADPPPPPVALESVSARQSRREAHGEPNEGNGGGLVVHVGERRVGALDEDATAAFAA